MEKEDVIHSMDNVTVILDLMELIAHKLYKKLALKIVMVMVFAIPLSELVLAIKDSMMKNIASHVLI